MAEPASSLIEIIVRKVSEFARRKKLVSRAADWLGFTDEAEVSKQGKSEYQEEDYSLKKWSYFWITHRMQPANKYFWIIVGTIFLVRLVGLGTYLPAVPPGVPALVVIFLIVWLILRWLGKKTQPQTSELAFKLRIQSRGMYWWTLVAMGHHIFTSILTWVFDLVF